MLSSSGFDTLLNAATRARLLAAALLAFGLGAAPSASAGQTFTFDGKAMRDCTLNGSQYTCTRLPQVEWDDKMAIASGYAVHVTADINPDWNYGLTMSGTARLTGSGNIDLTRINPASVNISGGSFEAAGTFRIGPPTRVVANITAGSLFLGTGPEFNITGTMVSRGAVNVASAVTINGSVTGTSYTSNSSVRVTGAITATGPVSIGSGNTIGSHVTGTSITTDSSVTITGDVRATNGPLAIGSQANITGAMSGTIVSTTSPVTLKGNVTASERFTLASGSTVGGNVTAPVTELLASNSVVTGKVTALTSLVLGSSVRIDGDVDTGQLRLEASNATISGNAYVDFARLQWQGKVSKKIYCKSGTRTGYCDCVDNQSGWPVNSAEGPRCEADKPAPGLLDHFLVTHDGNASVCAPKTVQVKACGDATCSQPFTGGVDVTLSPGGAKVSIGSSGSATATVSRSTPGTVDLLVNHAGTAATRCRNDGANNASCSMAFSGGVSFDLLEAKFRAGETGATTITAKAYNEASKTCVAAFQNQQKDIQYSCAYSMPTSGTEKLGVSDAKTGAAASMTCSPTSGATLNTVRTSFDANGSAPLKLAYEDAGQLQLKAKFEDATGSAAVHVAPHRFTFSNLPSVPIRAGVDFNVGIKAVSASGKITKNFDRSRLPANVTSTTFTVGCLRYPVTTPIQPTADTFEFTNGEVTAKLSWREVGSMHLDAATTSSFPNTSFVVTGRTGNDAGCASLGPFIPHHYLVEKDEPATAPPRSFYYAGEPIPLRISARNAAGAVTTYYSNGQASEAVSLDAFDQTGATANPKGGKLSLSTVGADKFDKGVALAGPAYASPIPATGQRLPLAPTVIRLRARNTAALTSTSPDNVVSSAGVEAYETARPLVRNGRLRIATRFGRSGSTLQVPVTAEYWTGNSWLLNDLDDVTVVPASAIAQRAQAHAGSAAAPGTQTFTSFKLAKGKAELPITSNQPGWIDLAFNLGSGTGLDQSCLAAHPHSSRANLPWLQSFSSCIDPSGRATFGIYASESRRLIHVREVFR